MVIAETRAWLEHAVIGLNLCPFAKAVVARQQVRFATSAAADRPALQASLVDELVLLTAADPAEVDTTLLVCPMALPDFDDYNQFLDVAEATLRAMDLEGVIQVASFHPHYRFAGTEAGDVTNASNRSPYPMLHLLREDSVARALAAFANPEAIYTANMRTLQALGEEGWKNLEASWSGVRKT